MSHCDRLRRASGHSDMLDELSERCRRGMQDRSHSRMVEQGDALWLQGEPATGIALVVKGTVMSQFEARSGRLGTIGFWGPGDLVGLGELARRAFRQHTVCCLEPCTFLLLSFGAVDELVAEFPEFASALIRAVATRLSWATQLALALQTGKALERICTVLLALAERFGNDRPGGVHIRIQLTNEQLAAISGVTRQFANETLRQLRGRSVIAPGRRLVLTDMDALEEMAFS